MQTLAIDLGKQSFHIHGITHDGEVVSKKVSRVKLVDTVNRLHPQSIAMEACASAHHWGRTLVLALDNMLVEICREDERCKRLTTLPGVGPIVATSLVAAIDDGRHFKPGRALSAWIGLVPRQYTTGGKPRLGETAPAPA